jgi:hypothetical protein
MADKYKVGIIGCGRIGALKQDKYDGKDKDVPLTHASAVYHHPGFELVWLYDINNVMLGMAREKWGVKADRRTDVDIVVISCSTESHFSTFKYICKGVTDEEGNTIEPYPFNKPKVVIIEKPVGMNIYETTAIDYMAKEAGIIVFVNYNRMYCDLITDELYRLNESGVEFISIVGYYGDGTVRTACHMINVINKIAGNFIECHILDTELDTDRIHMEYSKCKNVELIPVPMENYSIFEMQVLTRHERIDFIDAFRKICIYLKIKEKQYGNWPKLSAERDIIIDVDLSQSLTYLYDNVKLFLDSPVGSVKIKCGIGDALKVQNVLEKINTQKHFNIF